MRAFTAIATLVAGAGAVACPGESRTEDADSGANFGDTGMRDSSPQVDSGRSDRGPTDAGEEDDASSRSDSDASAFASCDLPGAGTARCGELQESCCATTAVEGGTFYRTYDLDADGGAIAADDGGPSGETDPATVSSFRLDKYLVTVGRFRSFVTAVVPTDAGARGYTPPAGSGKHARLNSGQGLANGGDPGTYEPGWVASDSDNIAPTDANLACEPPYDTWTSMPDAQEDLPINCVNWYESYAFCIWDGGFLPSEAEWEYAAAGGGGAGGQRSYPWGNAAPGTTNRYAIYGCNYYAGPPLEAGVGPCVGAGNIAPVGTAAQGAGRWGQLDLAGDMFEWNLDWYAPYTPCVDCASLTLASFATDYRVNRGGLFNLSASLLSPRYRNSVVPTGRSAGVGFRCARNAP